MSAGDQAVSRSNRSVSVFCLSFVVMFIIAFAWTSVRDTQLDDPPAPWNVDGIFYDNIAFNLNRGDGFVVDLHAQPWRQTYFQMGNKSEQKGLDYSWLRPVEGTGPTALRSPLYPFVLSRIYRVFGHDYRTARLFGVAFVACGLALLLTFCMRRWGILPAGIAAATLSVDFSVMNAAGTLATESLAVLIFAVTFLLLVNAWESPTYSRWSIAGVSFACLMLTRGIWSLGWLILVAVSVLFFIPPIRRLRDSLRANHLVVFLFVAMFVALPWWIRNCQVTGQFSPFGTAGSCGFVGAYCDESLAQFGQWQADVYNRNQIEVQRGFNMETASLAEVECSLGRSSMEKTVAWCKTNWTRLPQLMGCRALSHWGFFNPSVPLVAQIANVWLVVIGLVGCFTCTGRLKRLFILVLLLDTLLVMLTWEHMGRYAIPIRPVVHLGYGVAVGNLVCWLFPGRGGVVTRLR